MAIALTGFVPRLIYTVICFLVGTFMGSFVGVLIYRIPRDQQWVRGHSVCPACGHELGVRDLIPIWSFVFLRGRCRYCRAPIGRGTLWIEIVTGSLLAGVGLMFGWSIATLKFMVMATLALAVGVIDLQTGLVPDSVVLPGAVLGMAFAAFGGWTSVLSSLEGAALGSLLFVIIILLSRGGMGWGDATFGLMLGSFLGFRLTIVFLMLAFVIGALAGVILMVFFRRKGKDAMPFGPAMAAGAYIACLAGNRVISWYLALLLAR